MGDRHCKDGSFLTCIEHLNEIVIVIVPVDCGRAGWCSSRHHRRTDAASFASIARRLRCGIIRWRGRRLLEVVLQMVLLLVWLLTCGIRDGRVWGPQRTLQSLPMLHRDLPLE